MRIAVNENDPISIRNAILLLQQRMNSSSVAWDDVTDKPTTFPPETHTHSGDDITSAVGEAAHAGSADTATNADYANSAASADSVLWADIPDKPMSFPPDAHNHDTSYVLRSEMGAVNGVAELDATGKVPSAQLPASTSVELWRAWFGV